MAEVLQTFTSKEDWQGDPIAINRRFNPVLALYKAEDEAPEPQGVVFPPVGSEQDVARTKAAMVEHRKELPASFDEVMAFATLEIANLQGKNFFQSDIERQFVLRQIDVLKTIHSAVGNLRELVPQSDEMPATEAEEAERILRQIVGRLKAWPNLPADQGRTNLERTVDRAIETSLEATGKVTRAAFFGGLGYVLLLLWGPHVAAGALGLAFGKDAVTSFKGMIAPQDQTS